MAIQTNNLLMHGMSGIIGKQLTFKQYNGKTVVSRYSDMSKVVYSRAQLAERFRFKLAVAYAKAIIADPAKKQVYARKKHFSAYHAAIAEYMNTSKAREKAATSIPVAEEKTEKQVKLVPRTLEESKVHPISPAFSFPDVQAPS